MSIHTKQYTPLLKWRQGEYQALLRLDDQTKEGVVPLIVIPPVEYDFEEKRDKKTPEEHLEPFARRFKAKWGHRPALIDVHHSLEQATRTSGKSAIASVFAELRDNAAIVVPVIDIRKVNQYLDDVEIIQKEDKRGVALRVLLSDLMGGAFSSNLTTTLNRLSIGVESIDLIIDLESPKNFAPYDDFGDAITGLIGPLGDLGDYRSLVVISTSYPESQSIQKPGGTFIRHEWELYNKIHSKLAAAGRAPSFGDYGIERPEFLRMDMRLVKPAGKIVYTTPSEWLIRKGGSFRDDPQQMRDHCNYILESGEYRGETFSAGDKYIKDCAAGAVSTSNLTGWKWIGMNHHMTQIVEDLSKYHA